MLATGCIPRTGEREKKKEGGQQQRQGNGKGREVRRGRQHARPSHKHCKACAKHAHGSSLLSLALLTMKAYASLADLDQGFLQHTQSVPTPNETWEVIIVLSNVWKELDLR